MTLDKDRFIDKDYFDYFFAFRFSKIDIAKTHDFLLFTFVNHFNKDIRSFTDFIRFVILKKHKNLIGDEKISIINEILNPTLITENQSVDRTNRESTPPPEKLESILTDKGLKVYNFIFNEFCNKKPIDIILLSVALKESKLLSSPIKPLRMHRALTNTFPEVGTDKNMYSIIKKVESNDPRLIQRINEIKKLISKEIAEKMIEK
jgi:hypothetical protein